MTIAFGAIGAKSTGGTTTTAVAYPASVGAADFLLLADCGWPSSAGVNALSGWAVTQLGGGTGVATDSHTTTMAVFRKEAVGGETGTVSVGRGGAPTGQLGIMARYTKTAASWAAAATGSGTDNTHGTDRSITTGTIDLAPGDMVVIAVAVDTNTASTITSPTLTASGITFGTVTQRTSGAGDTIGEHGNVELFDALVTAGSGTVAATFAFTTATTQCGPVVVTRLREGALPAQPVRRRFGFLPRTKARTSAPVPAQVVVTTTTLPPQPVRDRLTTPIRRRAFTARPVTTTVTVTTQTLPPQSTRDRLFWFPRPRPRSAQPVPAQVVVQATLLPAQPVRDRLLPPLRRRTYRTTVTVAVPRPPAQPVRDRLPLPLRRRTFAATPLPVVTVTTQALPPQPVRDRWTPLPRRRPVIATPVATTITVQTTQALPPQPTRRRLPGLPRRRATAPQLVVVAVQIIVVTTPGTRTLIVAAEARSGAVPIDPRTATTPAETRTGTVAASPRVYTVPAENRTSQEPAS